MYLKFPGYTDLQSWGRDLSPRGTDVDRRRPRDNGIGGYIYQHTEDLLGVTVTARRVSSKHKLIAAGCVLVQDGDAEGTFCFEPNDTEASLAVLKIIRLK